MKLFKIKSVLLLCVFILGMVFFFVLVRRKIGIIKNKPKLTSENENISPTLVDKSPVIKSVILKGDIDGSPISIPNSYGDLWFSTWADDDKLYTTWGDGRGFGNTLSDIGIARLDGELPLITGENVYFEKHPGLLGLKNNDKPSSLLFIDGRLYGHFFSPLARPWIGYNAFSDDYGRTWTRVGFYQQGENKPLNASPWTSDKDSNFRCLSFVNMGKNYELNLDGYVYGYGLPQAGAYKGGIFLTRVKKDQILNYSEYEYFAGLKNNMPVWSKEQSKARKVPGLVAKSQVSVAYHPGINRYLLLTSENLFDAPNPWGPWTHSGSWNNQSLSGWNGGYQPGIITKNMGKDYFWFTISGQPKKGAEVSYKLNLGKIILKTY